MAINWGHWEHVELIIMEINICVCVSVLCVIPLCESATGYQECAIIDFLTSSVITKNGKPNRYRVIAQ